MSSSVSGLENGQGWRVEEKRKINKYVVKNKAWVTANQELEGYRKTATCETAR